MRGLDALLGDRGRLDLHEEIANTREGVVEMNVDLEAQERGVPIRKRFACRGKDGRTR
jgi:hypothetical protein